MSPFPENRAKALKGSLALYVLGAFVSECPSLFLFDTVPLNHAILRSKGQIKAASRHRGLKLTKVRPGVLVWVMSSYIYDTCISERKMRTTRHAASRVHVTV